MSKILQLKISLDGFKPLIWRKFLVEDSISFHQLHNIIQKVMGWDNYHLYNFDVGNNIIQAENPQGMFVDSMWTMFRPKTKKIIPSEKTKLNDIIKDEKQKFSYVYDFGDNWQHSIVVEKIMEKDPSQKYPVCIDGEMSCPPEDCGSVYGYEELLKIRENKNHPEYKERIVEWLGEDFDPELFVVDWVNARLSGKRPAPVWVKSKVDQNNCTHDFEHLVKNKKYDVFKCKKCEFVNKVWKI
jgi:hypothetical protein